MTSAEAIARLAELEADESLLAEENFDARADALEEINAEMIDRFDAEQDQSLLTSEWFQMKKQAEDFKSRLEEADNQLFLRLRKKISNRCMRGEAFKDLVASFVRIAEPGFGVCGYDNLDLFINRLLSDLPMPVPTLPQEKEMIFYQKTAARIIFEMAGRIGTAGNDHFIDIGSGLGQAVILVHLLTGMPATGIEFEPAFCRYARSCASALVLKETDFTPEKAGDADYSAGTVFFLYTPFVGEMLQQVLQLLRRESQKRAIQVFTYGPCSEMVSLENWLEPVAGIAGCAESLCVFKSG